VFLDDYSFFLGRLFIVHAAFEFLDAVADAPGKSWQLLRSKKQDRNGENQNQFHRAEAEYGEHRIHNMATKLRQTHCLVKRQWVF